MPAFNQLPTFTRGASYRCNIGWAHLESTLKDYKEMGLDMDPDFQRVHVWTPEQQSAYIEYIIMGGESGRDIYFNHPGWMGTFKGEFVLVDGKQRTEAVLSFLDNRTPAFKHYYHEYTGKMPSCAEFVVNINNLQTRKEVLQWYIGMNFRGTPHTSEELEKVRKMVAAE